METIYSIEGLRAALSDNKVAVIYYSNETCNVCKVLKPRIREMLDMQFPNAKMHYVDIEKSPVVSGQYRVFSIPTIDIYIDGKEHARFSRNVTMHDFEAAMRRPYDLIYSE